MHQPRAAWHLATRRSFTLQLRRGRAVHQQVTLNHSRMAQGSASQALRRPVVRTRRPAYLGLALAVVAAVRAGVTPMLHRGIGWLRRARHMIAPRLLAPFVFSHVAVGWQGRGMANQMHHTLRVYIPRSRGAL